MNGRVCALECWCGLHETCGSLGEALHRALQHPHRALHVRPRAARSARPRAVTRPLTDWQAGWISPRFSPTDDLFPPPIPAGMAPEAT